MSGEDDREQASSSGDRREKKQSKGEATRPYIAAGKKRKTEPSVSTGERDG